MKRLAMTILAAAVLAFAGSASAQQQNLADAQITTKDLGRGAYMLLGPGGNITVVTGSNGIIVYFVRQGLKRRQVFHFFHADDVRCVHHVADRQRRRG